MISLAADQIDQRHSLICQITLKPVLPDDEHLPLVLRDRWVAHDQMIAVIPGGAVGTPAQIRRALDEGRWQAGMDGFLD